MVCRWLRSGLAYSHRLSDMFKIWGNALLRAPHRGPTTATRYYSCILSSRLASLSETIRLLRSEKKTACRAFTWPVHARCLQCCKDSQSSLHSKKSLQSCQWRAASRFGRITRQLHDSVSSGPPRQIAGTARLNVHGKQQQTLENQ